MKPPFRRRTKPPRLWKSTEQEQAASKQGFFKGWTRKDLQSFLQAVKQQKNFESELDLTEIHKKVPHHSLKEIEDLIKTLKSRVLHKLYLQIQSQRREERRAKVPIETWEELVQKISRSHEKTISSAFSQMLVIAATEPCGLMNSEPPHPIVQTPAFSSLHAIQPPKAPSWISTLGTSPKSCVSTTSATSLIQPDFSSNTVDHISKLDSASVSSPAVPRAPTTSQMMRGPNLQQSEAEPAATSPAFAGPASPSVSSNKNNPAQLDPVDDKCQNKPRMCVMNFNKIYQYLSGTDSKTCSSALTSMESAVLLDVLMCLPEELPLLDCKELQHHLLQSHAHLSMPAVNPSSSSGTQRSGPQAKAADSTAQTHKPAAGSSEEHVAGSADTQQAKDEDEWATAGTCPLNPLLVPVGLLKRRTVDSEK